MTAVSEFSVPESGDDDVGDESDDGDGDSIHVPELCSGEFSLSYDELISSLFCEALVAVVSVLVFWLIMVVSLAIFRQL